MLLEWGLQVKVTSKTKYMPEVEILALFLSCSVVPGGHRYGQIHYLI